MNSPFRLAVVGIDHPHGAGWRTLLPSLVDEIEVVAIVPGYAGAITSLEERYAHLPRFETVTELITWNQFDGAIVCLPNNEEPTALLELANARKHLLAEKPVGGSAESLRPLVETVNNQGVVFQNGYMIRYDQGANRLREMVAEGRFGKLISLEMSFVTSDVQRRGPEHYLFDAEISTGGFFNWLACHYLDLLFYITQQAVVGVTARTGNFGATSVDVEDGGIAILDLADGSIATFLGGYWIPRWAGESRWCLRGSERWVNWDPTREGTGGVLEIHGPKPQWFAMEETFTIPPNESAGYGGRNGLALVQDWLNAIRENRKCRNTVESTHTTLQLIDTIYQSSQEQRRIECCLEPH